MNTWWGTLRSLFICNEFWHHPDPVLLFMLTRVAASAPRSEHQEWIRRLGSLSLILPEGNVLPFQHTQLSFTEPIPEPLSLKDALRQKPKTIISPFSLRSFSVEVNVLPEYASALKTAIKALARMRSFYNSGRMKEDKFGRQVGPPPLVSMQYKRQLLSQNRVYDFASWNGSGSPRPFSAVIEHIVDIASEVTTYRVGIPDPRKYLYEDHPDDPTKCLDLPLLCSRLHIFPEDDPTEGYLHGYVTEEVIKTYGKFTGVLEAQHA